MFLCYKSVDFLVYKIIYAIKSMCFFKSIIQFSYLLVIKTLLSVKICLKAVCMCNLEFFKSEIKL